MIARTVLRGSTWLLQDKPLKHRAGNAGRAKTQKEDGLGCGVSQASSSQVQELEHASRALLANTEWRVLPKSQSAHRVLRASSEEWGSSMGTDCEVGKVSDTGEVVCRSVTVHR